MNRKSRTFTENGLLPTWKIRLNYGLHNSVKTVQCPTVLMARLDLVVVGYFLSVNVFFVCSKWAWVGWIGAERAAGYRAPHSAALVCKAGVAAVRGRVGTGRRLDTQTECFAPGRIQLHAPCYTHTHSQPSTIIFCPFFLLSLSIHPICLFSMPSFRSHILLSSPLSQNVSVSVSCSRFAAMPSKKKGNPCLLWCTSTIILFSDQASLSSISATAYLVLALPVRDPEASDEWKAEI